MGVKDTGDFYAKDKEVNIMPSIEMVECERVAYINEMKEYLDNLKNMERAQARKMSFENLVKSQIIRENGEFTEHYEFIRMSTQKRSLK